MTDRENAETQQLVEHRAACRDCRDGLGKWTDHCAQANLQARAHHHSTGHDTVVQTRRTTTDDGPEVSIDG